MLVLDQNSWMFRPFSQVCLLSHCDPTSLNQDDDDLSSFLSHKPYRLWWGSNLTETPRLRLFSLSLSLSLFCLSHPLTTFRFQPLVTTNQHFNILPLIKNKGSKNCLSWQCYESCRLLIIHPHLYLLFSLSFTLLPSFASSFLTSSQINCCSDCVCKTIYHSHTSSHKFFYSPPSHIFFQVNEQMAHQPS